MDVAIKKQAQLTGVFVVLPDEEFSWASREEVINAVMDVGGFVVDRITHPRKTVVVLSEEHIGQVPDELVQACFKDDVWVMTDGWLRALLTIGNRPGGNQSLHYGVDVVEGHLVKPYPRRRAELDLPQMPGSVVFTNASLDYQNIHNPSSFNF